MMRIVLSALLLLLATSALAETRYVDDHLVITMRTGKANTYQILRTLPSGTELTLLEEDGEYSRVRTADGLEGWVLTQYLSDTPIAKIRLARTEQQRDRLITEKQQLARQLAALKEEKASMERAHSRLGNEAEALRSELAALRETAARPLELAQENEAFKNKLSRLQGEFQRLQRGNERLQDHSQRNWFLAGAGVLVGGILLGLLLPRLQRKKRGMFD